MEVWIILLLIILLIVVAIIYIRRPRDEINEEALDRYYEAELPLSEPPADYLNAKFAYRYVDSFVYETPNELLKVYPLCCATCKCNALRQITAQKAFQTLPGYSAKLKGIARYAEPPRNQGQGVDKTTYVVHRLEKLQRFPEVRNLTAEDLANFMKRAAEIPSLLGFGVRDMSIANVGRNSEGALVYQHLDDVACSHENLYYNRYNVLKHLAPESLAPEVYPKYQKMLALIKESHHHRTDLPKFLAALQNESGTS